MSHFLLKGTTFSSIGILPLLAFHYLSVCVCILNINLISVKYIFLQEVFAIVWTGRRSVWLTQNEGPEPDLTRE